MKNRRVIATISNAKWLKHMIYTIMAILIFICNGATAQQMRLVWEADAPHLQQFNTVMDSWGNVYTAVDKQSTNPTSVEIYKVASDGNIAWHRSWISNNSTPAYPIGTVVDPSGNVYVGMRQMNVRGEFSVLKVRSYAPDGNIRWTTTLAPNQSRFGPNYSNGDYYGVLYISSSGTIYVVSRFNVLGAECRMDITRVFIFALNSNGVELWSREYDPGNPGWFCAFYMVEVDDNDGLWIEIETGKQNCMDLECRYTTGCLQEHFRSLVRYSPNGVMELDYSVGVGNSNLIPRYPQATKSGNFYITDMTAGTLTKLNRSGSEEWTINISLFDSKVHENPLNGDVYYRDGVHSVTCYDVNGTQKWTQNTSQTPQGKVVVPVHFDDQGYYYGFYRESGTYNYWWCKVDGSTGNLVWQYSTGVGSWQPNSLYFIDVDPNGDLLFAGYNKIYKFSYGSSLTLYDANNDIIDNKEFYLIRVADDTPLFTPDTLGIVTTDADGKIQLTPVP